MQATITQKGRAAMAMAIAKCALHLAWGSGRDEWDAPGAEIPSYAEAEALVCEVGRRIPAIVGYVTPDETGGIIIPVGTTPDGKVQTARYRLVSEPTPYLYFRADYDFDDGQNATIREAGIFVDPVVKEGLPPGQQYFTPDQILEPGYLFCAQRIDTLLRSASQQQSIQFVQAI